MRECPYCGRSPKLIPFYESCDGRGDRMAKVVCDCGAKMTLTWDEFSEICDKFGYKGGYYSYTEGLLDAVHQKLIERWNSVYPEEPVTEELLDYVIYNNYHKVFHYESFSTFQEAFEKRKELIERRESQGLPSDYIIFRGCIDANERKKQGE